MRKKKVKVRRKFLDWLVETFRPGYHVAKNPKKGVKRKKKVPAPQTPGFEGLT
jgi:recombinational DNA repair ATPase RecF